MRENREEEPRTTEEILSLGLGLSADKKTMEERVRGVFSRRRSTALAAAVAFGIVALALLLCFTTVLRPVEEANEGGAITEEVPGGEDGKPAPLA